MCVCVFLFPKEFRPSSPWKTYHFERITIVRTIPPECCPSLCPFRRSPYAYPNCKGCSYRIKAQNSWNMLLWFFVLEDFSDCDLTWIYLPHLGCQWTSERCLVGIPYAGLQRVLGGVKASQRRWEPRRMARRSASWALGCFLNQLRLWLSQWLTFKLLECTHLV